VFARISSGGTAAWYLTDYEGSVVGMTDATGTPQATISYDGFGNVLANSNSSFTDRYLYTGEQFNSTTGLQFNQGRYYDPTLGPYYLARSIFSISGCLNSMARDSAVA